jgi:hypothetical protein
LVALAVNGGAVLFLLELDVGVFHLHDWKYLLHLMDGGAGVLFGLLAHFWGLASDRVHLVVCCSCLILLSHVCNQSWIEVESIVEVLCTQFEF